MKNLKQFLQSPLGLCLAVSGSALFSGLFVYFKSREEEGYRATQVASLPDAKNWVLNKLDYTLLANQSCILNYDRLKVDPWKCFDPYAPFPIAENCSMLISSTPDEFPFDPEKMFFQAALGIFLFFGITVAAHKSSLPEFKGRVREALHVIGTLLYTFAVTISFPIAEFFGEGPRAAQLAKCKTLFDTVQSTCQLFSPINATFFPACREVVKFNATFPNSLTLADLNSIQVNVTGNPEAETPIVNVLSYVNMELLTCSIFAIFTFIIARLAQKEYTCFKQAHREPLQINDADQVRIQIDDHDDDESLPLLAGRTKSS